MSKIYNIGDLVLVPSKGVEHPIFIINKIKILYFENKEHGHNKFWEVYHHNEQLITKWGRIGSRGTKKTNSFGNHFAAEKYMQKLIKKKLSKGYKSISESFSYKISAPSLPNYHNSSVSADWLEKISSK